MGVLSRERFDKPTEEERVLYAFGVLKRIESELESANIDATPDNVIWWLRQNLENSRFTFQHEAGKARMGWIASRVERFSGRMGNKNDLAEGARSLHKEIDTADELFEVVNTFLFGKE